MAGTTAIPVSQAYGEAAGFLCERVSNRSLLLDKLALPKAWNGPTYKKASEWSLMRAASNGAGLLKAQADKLDKDAGGRNVDPVNAQRFREEARVCRALAQTAAGAGKELEEIRQQRVAGWIRLLEDAHPPPERRMVYARLEGRLAINLADGLIENGGICLDRIFGTPCLPGSAVKGVARVYARGLLETRPEGLADFVRVFGAVDETWKSGDLGKYAARRTLSGLPKDGEMRGSVVFLPAMPLGPADIAVDIVNVHTPDYYKSGQPSDLATEKPIPNFFPVVERGAVFVFPLLLRPPGGGGPGDGRLLDCARGWLAEALAAHGLGAKTAAGYGWFADVTGEVEGRGAERRERERAEEAERRAAAEAKSDPALVKRFVEMKESDFSGAIKPYRHEKEYWPSEPGQGDVYRRSLLQAALERPPLSGKDAKKALAVLARHYGVDLP